MRERWRVIKRWPTYQVSDRGRVRRTEDRVHRLRAAGRPEYEQLAEEFGITVATIHDVVARRTWSHI